MADTTAIAWCDATFNGWKICTPVSPGCTNCYAAALARRFVWGEYAHGVPRQRTSKANWAKPRGWNRLAEQGFLPDGSPANGRRPSVFCASLSDVFDNEVDGSWRQDLFELIRVTPALDWLVLTKRPQNILRMVREHGAIAGNGAHYLPENVWLGTTVCTQAEADRNIPVLLRTRAELGARVLFLSIEPQLEAIDITQWLWPFKPCADCPCPEPDVSREGFNDCCHEPDLQDPALQWVICGGESGPNARPFDVAWARSLRDQCQAAQVPFFCKQLGAQPVVRWADLDEDRHVERAREARLDLRDRAGADPAEWPEDLRVQEFPRGA